jgi:hypothetical protein
MSTPPGIGFEALVNHYCENLAFSVGHLRITKQAPNELETEHLRAQLAELQLLAPDRDARAALLEATRRHLEVMTPRRELANALTLLDWVADSVYGPANKGTQT